MKIDSGAVRRCQRGGPTHHLLRLLSGMGLLALLLAIAGCEVATTSPATATAAGDLDVKIILNDAPVGGTVYADMAITLNPNLVTQFSHGETATCNGVLLQGSILGFQGRVPTQPNGGAYVFTYTANQKSTSVTVAARRGTLLTPLAHSVISRVQNLFMTYEPAKDLATVSGYASTSSSSAPDGPSQPNNGAYTLGASALSSLAAGSGYVGLHWSSSANGTVSGPAFRSLSTQYDSFASEQVTWS